MAVTILDTFTEASLTALTAHTPDTGTGWTEEFNDTSGLKILEIKAGSGVADATASEVNDGIIVTAQPDPVEVEYDLEQTWSGVEALGAVDWAALFARFADTDNFYVAVGAGSANASSIRLAIRSGGTTTELTSGDQDPVAGDVWKFEIRDAAKKFYIDSGAGYVEVLSTDNNDITTAGKAGWGLGDCYVFANSGDVDGSWEATDHTRTEVESAVPVGPTELYIHDVKYQVGQR